MTAPTDFNPDAPALDDSGAYGLPHTAEQAQVILIPVPWEPTTSYRPGTVDGPAAIRVASRQVDLFDIETGHPWKAGIHMLDEDPMIRGMNSEARDAAISVIQRGGVLGDNPVLLESLARVNDLGGELNDWLRAETDRWLDAGKLVGVIGGDHSSPFGAIAATAARHPGMGVLHLDAHADLREAYEGFTWSHASIMHNVVTRLPDVAKLVQVGIRDLGEAEHDLIRDSGGRIVTFFDAEQAAARFAGATWHSQCERMIAALPAKVYLSFDIDGLDPAYCPHTGTPVPGGLSFAQVCYLLRALSASGKRIVGFDLTEVAPDPTPAADQWDGNVGARLLYKMIGWMLKTRG